jgi:ABC-type polysaccharide/polyol phosphate export systems, permease component
VSSDGSIVVADGMPKRAEQMQPQHLSRQFPALRTITALILREVSTRFGRTPGGFAWAIMQPLATILILGAAFSLISRTPALGTSFILFKATGMLPYQMFQNTSSMIGKSLSFSGPLLAYPGVTWGDAFVARLILNVLVNVAITTLILTGIIVALDLTLILDWNKIVLAMTLGAVLGFGIGTLNCYLMERITIWANVWSIINAPMMIMSGVLIMYDDLPREAQEIIWYNPAIHITGLMREGFYSTYQPSYISITYVLTCAMIPMVLGLLLVRRYHRELLER